MDNFVDRPIGEAGWKLMFNLVGCIFIGAQLGPLVGTGVFFIILAIMW